MPPGAGVGRRGRGRWVLSDLDGTLTDPGPGITRYAAHALARCGYAAPDPGTLSWMVGPPLRESFARQVGTADPAALDALIAAYRERFATVGRYEHTVCAGIPELLAACREAGCVLAVATAKPAVFAREILRHFGLAAPFSAVVGSSLDGRRSDRAAVIRRAPRRRRPS